MDVEATPPLPDSERRALVVGLEQAGASSQTSGPYGAAWRVAALREATLGDETDADYAFSPRSTRGATRA